MPSRKANLAHFYFFSGALAPETFEVVKFKGKEAISEFYSFHIELLSANWEITPDKIINKPATLYIYRDGEFYPFSGIVSEFKFLGKVLDRASYSLTLVPRLWLLTLNIQTRIFQKKKVFQIIKQVLDDANLNDSYSFNLDESKYPELEYVVQYQESDFNFIARLMEHWGIWYFFNENPILEEELDGSCSAEKMIITDKPSLFDYIPTKSDIVFKPISGMADMIETKETESINSFEVSGRIIPKEVLFKDYNYRTPETDLKSRKPIKTGEVGTVYKFGAHFKNTIEAEKLCEIMANSYACNKIVIEGTSNCRGMRAGKRFSLQQHYLEKMNEKYVLTNCEHEGSHLLEKYGTYTYLNKFVCIPASQAEIYKPVIKTEAPKIPGIITAKIEANGSEYAMIDEMGRYKVRLPFDLSESKNYEASRFIRLAQPYAGSNYGFHFPSHEGVEMVLACVNGDPDRPLGLSVVPNANTVSPVTSSNKHQNIIRTAGGNEILIDDEEGKQRICISTKSSHTLEMNDENKYAMLQTKNKNKIILDDNNECVSWNAKDHNIKMTYKSGNEGIVITTGGGHSIVIDDKNKKITIKTKNGNIIEMDDNGKKISLADSAGKNKVTLDGNGGKLFLDSQGEITINATKDLTIKAANIKMSSQGKIEAKATSDLTLKGMKISQKADMDFEIKGLNIKAEGQMNATLKGSMQTKVEGMMTELSGNAMAKVKGGIVMIN
jgi:type VI secretion system secreted protein VgrG